MTPFSQRIWKELRQRCGPSDSMPSVQQEAFVQGIGATIAEVEDAISELLADGAMSALVDKELASLSKHKKLSGDFLVWVRSAADWTFLRVLTPTEVQHAAAARRELLRREVQQWEQLRGAKEHELRILEHCLTTYPPSPAKNVRGLMQLTQAHIGLRWDEALDLVRQSAFSPEHIAAAMRVSSGKRFPAEYAFMPNEVRKAMDQEFRWRCLAWVLALGPERSKELPQEIDRTQAESRWREAEIAALTNLMSTLEVEADASAMQRRDAISKPVRQEVWRRDQGRCVQCGSQERLHFDHIIPVTRGGSGTARNVQLLCERCNLTKGDSI